MFLSSYDQTFCLLLQKTIPKPSPVIFSNYICCLSHKLSMQGSLFPVPDFFLLPPLLVFLLLQSSLKHPLCGLSEMAMQGLTLLPYTLLNADRPSSSFRPRQVESRNITSDVHTSIHCLTLSSSSIHAD